MTLPSILIAIVAVPCAAWIAGIWLNAKWAELK